MNRSLSGACRNITAWLLNFDHHVSAFADVLGSRARALRAIGFSVGTLLLARTVRCPELRAELLAAGRVHAEPVVSSALAD